MQTRDSRRITGTMKALQKLRKDPTLLGAVVFGSGVAACAWGLIRRGAGRRTRWTRSVGLARKMRRRLPR